MKVKGSKAVLTFDYMGKGLIAKGGGALKGFAIAGEDGKYQWVSSQIKGNTVVVSAKGLSKPVNVRYCWGDYMECNLYNQDSLPAAPFRTDSP